MLCLLAFFVFLMKNTEGALFYKFKVYFCKK
jgi:hypothetical protein